MMYRRRTTASTKTTSSPSPISSSSSSSNNMTNSSNRKRSGSFVQDLIFEEQQQQHENATNNDTTASTTRGRRRVAVSWLLLQFWFRTLPVLVLDLVRLFLAVMVMAPGFARFAWYYWMVANHVVGIRYAPDSCRQRLDVYYHKKNQQQHATNSNNKSQKQSPQLAPVIVFVSGGGWMIGYKLWGALLARSLQHVAACNGSNNGCVIVMLDYRNYPVGTVPEQVQDVEAALVWTKRHAHQYGGDANRLVLVGESAGGHLGALLLLQKALGLSSTTTTTTTTSSSSSTTTTTAAAAAVNGKDHTASTTTATTTTTTFELSDCKGFVSMAAPLDLSCMAETYQRHGLDREGLSRIFGGKLHQCDPLQLVLQSQQQQQQETSSDDDDKAATSLPSSSSSQQQQLLPLLQRLPPMLICQGTHDATVPLQGSKAFCDALTNATVSSGGSSSSSSATTCLNNNGGNIELRTYTGWNHTRANVEGPMQGDYRFHRDVWEAVQQWTRSTSDDDNDNNNKNKNSDEELRWQELGTLCPDVLVQLGTFLMPV